MANRNNNGSIHFVCNSARAVWLIAALLLPAPLTAQQKRQITPTPQAINVHVERLTDNQPASIGRPAWNQFNPDANRSAQSSGLRPAFIAAQTHPSTQTPHAIDLGRNGAAGSVSASIGRRSWRHAHVGATKNMGEDTPRPTLIAASNASNTDTPGVEDREGEKTDQSARTVGVA